MTWSSTLSVTASTTSTTVFSGTITIDRYTGKQSGSFYVSYDVAETTSALGTDGQSPVLLDTQYCDGAWTGSGADDFDLNDPTGGDDVWSYTTLTHSNTDIEIVGSITIEGGVTETQTVNVSITLSDPYTSDDVNFDVNGLLGWWDLSDDKQYPWRTDITCNFGPKINFDEVLGAVVPVASAGPSPSSVGFTTGTLSGVDSSGNTYTFDFTPDHMTGSGASSATYSGLITDAVLATGDIIGKPNPAGYDPFWDSLFITYSNDGLFTPLYYGDYAPSYCPYATQWTNLADADINYTGAFAVSRSVTELTKCKWAEVVLFTAPSYNFGRPWGYRDALLRDQTTVDCGTEPCSPPYPNQYGNLLFAACPGIDGQNSITAATNASPIKITLEREAGWRTGDSIDISGCVGNTAANGTGRTITVIDSQNATIDGTTGNGTYTGGGIAISTGANSYQWNDNNPKGDWCLLTWTYDLRNTGTTPTVTTSQECSQFIPCCPVAIYITPKDGSQPTGETSGSNNSQSFDLPYLNLDSCYGALWQCIPKQWMTDPLWQKPAMPCNRLDDGCTMFCNWTEDDGSGQADGDPSEMPCKNYFPQRPFVECRASLPSGAPALPSGYTLVNPNDIGTNPPGLGVTNWLPVWFWSLNRQETVAVMGRFACEYSDPMAVCGDDSDDSPT